MNHARTKISLVALLEAGDQPEARFPYVYGSKMPILFSGSEILPDRVLQGAYNTLESLSGSIDVSGVSWIGSNRDGSAVSIDQSAVWLASA